MGLVSNAAGANLISPDAIMSRLHLQPQQVPQIQRIVAAGMKVMFDPRTHHLMQQTLAGPDPLPQKLGLGVAGLMGILWKESNQSLPQQLLIPAALVLLAHAIDYLQKTGTQGVGPDLFAQAAQVMIETILKARGLDPNAVANASARGMAGAAGAAPGGAGAAPAGGAAPGGAAAAGMPAPTSPPMGTPSGGAAPQGM